MVSVFCDTNVGQELKRAVLSRRMFAGLSLEPSF